MWDLTPNAAGQPTPQAVGYSGLFGISARRQGGMSSRRNRKNGLGIFPRDGQQRACSTTRLFATLLPALQGAHGNAKETGKLRLGQTRSLTGFGSRRDNNPAFAGLHVSNRLKYLCADIALRLKRGNLGRTEHFRLRGHDGSRYSDRGPPVLVSHLGGAHLELARRVVSLVLPHGEIAVAGARRQRAIPCSPRPTPTCAAIIAASLRAALPPPTHDPRRPDPHR